MINVDLFRAEGGPITSFSCRGHAGAADRGKDIVCAAVSMTVINTINSIEVLLPEDGKKMTVDSNDEKGEISFDFREAPSKEAALLLESMYLGLKTIEEDYKGEYIHITERR
ncbi:MAG: ribosomal-processing cysteine protease Prp [Lachnospiraceae bacterium]|nr:ribosomal-processing cysteine protease Prp [Lachnospiraceae bacterium]